MISLITAVALLSGCATAVPQGSLFTDVKVPVSATSNNKDKSKGRQIAVQKLSGTGNSRRCKH